MQTRDTQTQVFMEKSYTAAHWAALDAAQMCYCMVPQNHSLSSIQSPCEKCTSTVTNAAT